MRCRVAVCAAMAAGCGPEAVPVGPGGIAVSDSWCHPSVPDDASCVRVRVECDDLDDAHARVALTEPKGTPLGTVVLFSGAGGTAPFDNGFVPELVGRGFRTVQVYWEGDWQISRADSVKEAACRPATVLAWAFEEYHRADRATGYCGLGHSAGAAQFAFSLAHYGAGDQLDHVLLSSGPPLARIDAGCDPREAGFGQETTRATGCEEFSSAPFVYSDQPASLVDRWTGERDCGAPYGDVSDPDWLHDQSVLSRGAVLSYPQTRLDSWICEADQWGAAGQGLLFYDEVESELERHCATGCEGEESWSNPAEFRRMADTIVEQCVPRHQ